MRPVNKSRVPATIMNGLRLTGRAARRSVPSRLITRFLLILSLLGFSQPARAIILSIQPAHQTVASGSEFSVDVTISGLGAGVAPSIGAFDFDLMYDPSALAFTGLRFGDPSLGNQLAPLIGSVSAWEVDVVRGSINPFEVSLEWPDTLDALQADGFVLTTFSFAVLRPGTSTLTLANLWLGDSEGDPLFADSLFPGTITVEGGVVVPDSGRPAALMGFLSVALLLVRRLQFTRSKAWKLENASP